MSPKFTISWDDVKSLGATALLFGLAAVITYVMDHLTSLKLTDNELMITNLILGTVLKTLQKYLDGPSSSL